MSRNTRSLEMIAPSKTKPWAYKMVFVTSLGAALILVLFGCSGVRSSQQPVTLTVFAAASLIDPFMTIGHQFEALHQGVRVALVFAGSQQLATQIREGAKPDVFASANQTQMENVQEAGLVDPREIHLFAANRLVVILPSENPAGIFHLRDLAQPGIRLVVAASEVPIGKYTLDFLERSDTDNPPVPRYKEKVLQNVVSYENDVKAVVAKVILAEADAGIVYASDVSPEVGGKTLRIEIKDAWNSQADYPIAPINQSAQLQLAGAFVDYVLSPQGQAVLKQSGFLEATDEPAPP